MFEQVPKAKAAVGGGSCHCWTDKSSHKSCLSKTSRQLRWPNPIITCGAVGFSLVFAIVFALQHGGIFAGSRYAAPGFMVALLVTVPCLFVLGMLLGVLGAVVGLWWYRKQHGRTGSNAPHP